MWEPGLWLRNLTVNYLSADEEAAARESRASSPQPVLLMTCLPSLCKPLLSWLSQKQSLGKHIFTLEAMLLLPWLSIPRKTCVVVYEYQTPNICREPLSGAFGTTITHTKCSTSQTSFFFKQRELFSTQICKMHWLIVSILNPNQINFNMDCVSKAAVSPKIIFVSPNILDGPARRNMKTETEIHQKSPGPIQFSITCIHIQVPPRLWKDSTNNRPGTGILCSQSGFFSFGRTMQHMGSY